MSCHKMIAETAEQPGNYGRSVTTKKLKKKNKSRSQTNSQMRESSLSNDEEFFSAEESVVSESSTRGDSVPRVIYHEESWSSSSAQKRQAKQESPIPFSEHALSAEDVLYMPLQRGVSKNTPSQSTSEDSSFNESSLFDFTPPPTASTSLQTSFNETPTDSPNLSEYEEVPTDIDDYSPISPPRKEAIMPIGLLPTNDTPKYDSAMEGILASERQEEEDMKHLLDSLEDYEPDSAEEDQLVAMQNKFDSDEEASLPYMPSFPLYDSDSSEDDSFSIPDSLLAEMSSMGPDAPPRSPKREFKRFPYFVQHEITRVILALGISISNCDDSVWNLVEDYYEDLCKAPTKIAFCTSLQKFGQILAVHFGIKDHHMPPLIADNVWLKLKETNGWPNEIEFTGIAKYDPKSSEVNFSLELNPLELRHHMNRFSCRFGSDRFLTLRLPGLSWNEREKLPRSLRRLSQEDLRQQTISWLTKSTLDLLNRTWRCFYVKDDKKKRKEGGVSVTETFLVGFFFAENGIGLGNPTILLNDQLGFKEDTKVMRKELSREGLISWHMPLDKQITKMAAVDDYATRGGMFAKMWSRITLGLSTSRPTVTFKPGQIHLVRDIKSDPVETNVKPEVMNDGCCVCSPAVMRIVREKLGLSETPCCVQARVGGAKGIWFVDPDAELSSQEIWIKINESQLKYDFHHEDTESFNENNPDSCDWARMTLFVLSYPKNPSAATLNLQLVPILNNRGVPFPAFKDVLEEHLDQDLEELMQAATKRKELWYWLGGAGGMGQERSGNGQIFQAAGGFPLSDKEQMTMLLEAGFEPLQCGFLIDKLHKIVEQQCETVLDHLHIRIPQSTTVLCIADPTGTLKEGEISLQFSKGFLDGITKVRHECLEDDVLVARNPAHLPSDIQKVRAVSANHPGLRRLKDVVIFSTKGDFPLAGMLSGGDYDGDKIWVCWDRRFVKDFKNAYKPCTQLPEDIYFRKMPLLPSNLSPDTSLPGFHDQFFRRGFTIAMQENFLGAYTNMLETYAYSRKWKMDRKIIKYAMFCGVFVDAMKQGLEPTEVTLQELNGRKRMLERPAYKNPKDGSPGGNSEDWFILDRLVFDVAKKKADEKKVKFDALRATLKSVLDPHVTAVYHRERQRAEEEKNESGDRTLANVLVALQKDLRDFIYFWSRSVGRSNFKSQLPEARKRYLAIQPSTHEVTKNMQVRHWHETADEPHSYWKILKASTLCFVAGKTKWPWWVAASDLCHIKSIELSRISDTPAPRFMTQDIYLLTKPNPRFSPTETDTFD